MSTPNLPWEILFIVVGLASPADLPSLALTCTSLRDICRKHRHKWRQTCYPLVKLNVQRASVLHRSERDYMQALLDDPGLRWTTRILYVDNPHDKIYWTKARPPILVPDSDIWRDTLSYCTNSEAKKGDFLAAVSRRERVCSDVFLLATFRLLDRINLDSELLETEPMRTLLAQIRIQKRKLGSQHYLPLSQLRRISINRKTSGDDTPESPCQAALWDALPNLRRVDFSIDQGDDRPTLFYQWFRVQQSPGPPQMKKLTHGADEGDPRQATASDCIFANPESACTGHPSRNGETATVREDIKLRQFGTRDWPCSTIILEGIIHRLCKGRNFDAFYMDAAAEHYHAASLLRTLGHYAKHTLLNLDLRSREDDLSSDMTSQVLPQTPIETFKIFPNLKNLVISLGFLYDHTTHLPFPFQQFLPSSIQSVRIQATFYMKEPMAEGELFSLFAGFDPSVFPNLGNIHFNSFRLPPGRTSRFTGLDNRYNRETASEQSPEMLYDERESQVPHPSLAALQKAVRENQIPFCHSIHGHEGIDWPPPLPPAKPLGSFPGASASTGRISISCALHMCSERPESTGYFWIGRASCDLIDFHPLLHEDPVWLNSFSEAADPEYPGYNQFSDPLDSHGRLKELMGGKEVAGEEG